MDRKKIQGSRCHPYLISTAFYVSVGVQTCSIPCAKTKRVGFPMKIPLSLEFVHGSAGCDQGVRTSSLSSSLPALLTAQW